MPALCIIPARAVLDGDLKPSDLRVLLALGLHTDRAGAGAWPAARTIAKEARVSRSTVFECLKRLEERGYIQRTPRWVEGRQTSSMYAVVLDGGVRQLSDGGGPEAAGRGGSGSCWTQTIPINDPKNDMRPDQKRAQAMVVQAFAKTIFDAYPKRPEPYPYPAVMREVKRLLAAGASGQALVQAAERYAQEVERKQVEPTYRIGLVRFLHDDRWQQYVIPMVHGRTREEWARSGQDVQEFDRLVINQPNTEGGVSL